MARVCACVQRSCSLFVHLVLESASCAFIAFTVSTHHASADACCAGYKPYVNNRCLIAAASAGAANDALP